MAAAFEYKVDFKVIFVSVLILIETCVDESMSDNDRYRAQMNGLKSLMYEG